MDFNSLIKKGQPVMPPRIMLIGVEGVGKSSAGAAMPSPIFLCAEDGLVGPQFAGIANFSPKTFDKVLEFLEWLAISQHPYLSLIVDTIDWLEPKIFAHVIAMSKRQDIKSIEDFGYGKGYALAADEFRQFLVRLDKVVSRGINVMLLSHSQVKTFNNPIGDNYDRYEPKICKQIASLAKEWVDAILFARFDTYSKKEGIKVKGVGGDSRIVHTTHSAGWDAKNRYGLPETLPLDMPTILDAISKGLPAQTDEMIKELTELSAFLPEDKKEALKSWLAKASYTTTALAQTLNKVRVSVQQIKE